MKGKLIKCVQICHKSYSTKIIYSIISSATNGRNCMKLYLQKMRLYENMNNAISRQKNGKNSILSVFSFVCYGFLDYITCNCIHFPRKLFCWLFSSIFQYFFFVVESSCSLALFRLKQVSWSHAQFFTQSTFNTVVWLHFYIPCIHINIQFVCVCICGRVDTIKSMYIVRCECKNQIIKKIAPNEYISYKSKRTKSEAKKIEAMKKQQTHRI